MDGTEDGVGEPSFRDRFGALVCSFRIQIFYLLVIQVVLLMLALFSFALVDPGTSSHVILYVDLAVLLTTTALVVGVLYVCRQRTRWQ